MENTHPWVGRQVKIVSWDKTWVQGTVTRLVHPEGPAWEALFDIDVGPNSAETEYPGPRLRLFYSETERYTMQLVLKGES